MGRAGILTCLAVTGWRERARLGGGAGWGRSLLAVGAVVSAERPCVLGAEVVSGEEVAPEVALAVALQCCKEPAVECCC